MTLTFGPVTTTGEQAVIPDEYQLGTMLRRGHPDATPASAWAEVFWDGVKVGVLERVDWLQLNPRDTYSTYWFRSNSGATQIAGRGRDDVLRRVEVVLTEFANGLVSVAH